MNPEYNNGMAVNTSGGKTAAARQFISARGWKPRPNRNLARAENQNGSAEVQEQPTKPQTKPHLIGVIVRATGGVVVPVHRQLQTMERELQTLRAEVASLHQKMEGLDTAAPTRGDIQEVLDLPTPYTVRVRARVREVRDAGFVFVDGLAGDG